MDATAIREQLEDWVEQTIKDPNTGLPPDAKLTMDWSAGGRGFLIGPISEGRSEPDGGVRTRVIDMRLKFASLTPRREVARALDRLTTSMQRDPYLGGRFHPAKARYRDARIEDDAGGDWIATIAVAVATLE